MDQAQKLFRLERGDCCLAFCGDAQIAYPLFVQVGTTLNNHIKTRTRALDATRLAGWIGKLLNNLVDSWKLPKGDKTDELQGTRILFGGWSWENKRFEIGYFAYIDGRFAYHHEKIKLGHPWRESARSLVFIGDYQDQYLEELKSVLQRKYPQVADRETKISFDFDYEPIEALNALLKRPDPENERTAIGGAPQLVKVYPYGNSLPFAVRTGADDHFLLGRRLFKWEKTEHLWTCAKSLPPSSTP